MLQVGFDVVEFSAAFGNSTDPETVQNRVDGYIDWMENLPLFEQSIELGWADRPTLEGIIDGMRQWARGPDAFLALGRCEAVARKRRKQAGPSLQRGRQRLHQVHRALARAVLDLLPARHPLGHHHEIAALPPYGREQCLLPDLH